MGVSVPNGFATTADAFNQFLDQSGGVNQRIYELLDKTDIDDVSPALAKRARRSASGYRHSFQPELENASPRCLCTAFVG